MPFLWERPPAIIGHRGAPREATENTMASFRAALSQGAPAVELDARLSADGEVVVHHDARLGRVVAGEGAIEAMQADALAALGIPRLRDVLALPLLVDVELKADAENAGALPAAVLREIERAGALDRALVTSFDPALADEYARLARRPAGAIFPFAPEPADLDAWPRLAYVALVDDAAEQEVLDALREAKRTVLVWTVNDAARARALLDAGASGVITDRPGALLAARSAGAPGA